MTEAQNFDIALTAVEADVDIFIYYGDMAHSKHTLKAGCDIFKKDQGEDLGKGNKFAADETYFRVDLLHPSDQGHILMGRNLAEKMRGGNLHVSKKTV